MNQAQQEPWTKEDIKDVAKSQKIILYIILYIIVYTILIMLVPSLLNLIVIGGIIANIASTYFIYQLVVSLRMSVPWVYPLLYFVCGISPKTFLIGFVLLLIINSKATKKLKESGIKVGLIGAKMADFDNI